MKQSKSYSREEKIKYYKIQIYDLKNKLSYAEKRLAYLESDEYQDWNSALEKELDRKKSESGPR